MGVGSGLDGGVGDVSQILYKNPAFGVFFSLRERELRDAMLYFALLATDIHLRTRRKDIPNVYNTSKNNNSENCIDVRFSMALFVPFLAMLVIVLRGKISLA